MRWVELKDGLASMNLLALNLAIRNRPLVSSYLSRCLRHYDELIGQGLKDKDPVAFIYEQNWRIYSPDSRIALPARLSDDGGTGLDELLILASVTQALQPSKVFEIGTYNGRTTSVFALNASKNSAVYTLDLPPETSATASQNDTYIDTDIELIRNRSTSNFIRQLNLEGIHQIYCDSMQFDPTPYSGSIELGFIDGAHSLPYVRNDTVKMAKMMTDPGLVFWHDYGGKGRFRPLAEYLEGLARQAPVYRITGTTLAWAPSSSLRHLVQEGIEAQPSSIRMELGDTST